MTEITCKMGDGIEVILSDSDRIGDLIRILREYNQTSMQINIEDDEQDSPRINIELLEVDQR